MGILEEKEKNINGSEIRVPLLGMTLEQLQEVVSELKMPKFTAKQLTEWLYVRHADDIEEMSNISKKNRSILSSRYWVGKVAPMHAQRSVDGTVKYLYKVGENQFIEAVFIPDGDRGTLCVSSQLGCKMNCLFCMTGKQGFTKQLTANEIVNQIAALPEFDRLTNVVYMGMGEPLDNVDEVLRSLEVLTADYGYGWSPRRITVSTIGTKKGLRRFVEESACHLAVSLHASSPEARASLMPAEKALSMADIVDILREYDWSGQRRLSFEYIVFQGLNDTIADAKRLIHLFRGLHVRINLIRFHQIPNVELYGVKMDQMESFRDYLNNHGLIATIRASRGEDIFAACGMLSTDKSKKEESTI